MNDWLKSAGIRTLRTMAKTAVATIGTAAAGVLEVDWIKILSVSVLAGILSLLTSLGGLPELEK